MKRGCTNCAPPVDTCEKALLPLMSQLQRDMQHWELRSITASHLERLRSAKKDHGVRTALMLINGTVWLPNAIPNPKNPGTSLNWPHGRHQLLHSVVDDLRELVATHDMPPLELVINADDYPFVHRQPPRRGSTGDPTPLPLFSHYQTRKHMDILCPSGSFRTVNYDKTMLRGSNHYHRTYPWHNKTNEAFWQGAPYCGHHRFGRCSRYLLSHLTSQKANASQGVAKLDVGLSFYNPILDPYIKLATHAATSRVNLHSLADLPAGNATPLQQRKYVSMADHPKRRFLIHLDGHTCSYRLQSLLASNSLVLKQESYYWEYYYAALQPHVHYAPFWQTSAFDIFDVLANVSDPSRRVEMQRMARKASAFTHAHLNAHARQCYWRVLLSAYGRRLAYTPSLEQWPDAVKLPAFSELESTVDWKVVPPVWRRRDDLSVVRAGEMLEQSIAAQKVRGATESPGHRQASFESEIEKRSYSPGQ